MERFNLFLLQFTLCKSSLDGVHPSSLQHASHHYCTTATAKRRKAAVTVGPLPSPKSFPNEGGVQRELEDKYLQHRIPPDFQTSAKTEGMKNFFIFLIETLSYAPPSQAHTQLQQSC